MPKSWKITSLPVVLVAALVSAAHVPPRGGVSADADCLVETTYGDVQGVDLGASCAFLGIQFAASPAGANRWKPAQLSSASRFGCARIDPTSRPSSPRRSSEPSVHSLIMRPPPPACVVH